MPHRKKLRKLGELFFATQIHSINESGIASLLRNVVAGCAGADWYQHLAVQHPPQFQSLDGGLHPGGADVLNVQLGAYAQHLRRLGSRPWPPRCTGCFRYSGNPFRAGCV